MRVREEIKLCHQYSIFCQVPGQETPQSHRDLASAFLRRYPMSQVIDFPPEWVVDNVARDECAATFMGFAPIVSEKSLSRKIMLLNTANFKQILWYLLLGLTAQLFISAVDVKAYSLFKTFSHGHDNKNPRSVCLSRNADNGCTSWAVYGAKGLESGNSDLSMHSIDCTNRQGIAEFKALMNDGGMLYACVCGYCSDLVWKQWLLAPGSSTKRTYYSQTISLILSCMKAFDTRIPCTYVFYTQSHKVRGTVRISTGCSARQGQVTKVVATLSLFQMDIIDHRSWSSMYNS